jgi:hypothetical protein
MTMWGVTLLILIGLYGAVELVILLALKVATQPMPKQEPKICTRQAPHVCASNGPCNGFPFTFPNRRTGPVKTATFGRRTYAEGRPTMPSEVESDIEYLRRRR